MFKCAIIGVSGRRASGHAEAYRHIKRGKLVAVSSRTVDKLHAFGERFGVYARYLDYREMFERERPDLVHANTPPDVRLEVLEAADAAGVPAVVLEKPVAIQGEDYLELERFGRTSKTKVAVNHQLHFHPRRLALQRLIEEGRVGKVRFIEASARMNLAYQGTHSLQAISAFSCFAMPVAVFGQVAGEEGLRESPGRHYAPDQCVAAITYDGGIRAQLQCGSNAPAVGSGRVSRHKRVAAYGTRGHVLWTMGYWEANCDGSPTSGAHDYGSEDVVGQAGLTEAMFDWLEDDAKVHPLRLSASLRDFNVIVGLYMSALARQVVTLPVQPDRDLISSLRQQLARTQK